MAHHALPTPTQSECVPLGFQNAYNMPSSSYSTIHPRENQEDWPYRLSTFWSSDQQTRHMGTVPCLPLDYNTPRPKGAHGSWWYTDQAPPVLQLGTDARGIDAVLPLGYIVQTNGATSYTTPSSYYAHPQNFTF
eukprot:scaffold54015_cov48-Attheya_sp.AAC.4